jgi:hypothetical protein
MVETISWSLGLRSTQEVLIISVDPLGGRSSAHCRWCPLLRVIVSGAPRRLMHCSLTLLKLAARPTTTDRRSIIVVVSRDFNKIVKKNCLQFFRGGRCYWLMFLDL